MAEEEKTRVSKLNNQLAIRCFNRSNQLGPRMALNSGSAKILLSSACRAETTAGGFCQPPNSERSHSLEISKLPSSSCTCQVGAIVLISASASEGALRVCVCAIRRSSSATYSATEMEVDCASAAGSNAVSANEAQPSSTSDSSRTHARAVMNYVETGAVPGVPPFWGTSRVDIINCKSKPSLRTFWS